MLAADLVQHRVDVIYAPTGAATVAAKAAPPRLFQLSSLPALTQSQVELRNHCKMWAIPTIAEEDAKRPHRERETLVGEHTTITCAHI